MALLAEQIVEEWLSRQGYFTIRGLKQGVDEIDLLAVRFLSTGKWEKLHVEVQVSVRPVGYISKLSKDRQTQFEITGAGNATKRDEKQLKTAVTDWVDKKYFQVKKMQVKQALSGSNDWKSLFVHGKVKDQKELEYIEKLGVQLKDISEIIHELKSPTVGKSNFKTGSGTDIIELIGLI